MGRNEKIFSILILLRRGKGNGPMRQHESESLGHQQPESWAHLRYQRCHLAGRDLPSSANWLKTLTTGQCPCFSFPSLYRPKCDIWGQEGCREVKTRAQLLRRDSKTRPLMKRWATAVYYWDEKCSGFQPATRRQEAFSWQSSIIKPSHMNFDT